MNAVVKRNFAVKPVVAALTLAFAAVNAYAITPNQMPGAGRVTNVSTGATVNGGGVGTNVSNLVSAPDLVTSNIDLAGACSPRAVIQWGGVAGTGELLNPAGFNIGASAILNFTNSGRRRGVGAEHRRQRGRIADPGHAECVPGRSDFGVRVERQRHLGDRQCADHRAVWRGAARRGSHRRHGEARFRPQQRYGGSFIDITGGQSTVTIGPLASINGDAVLNVPAQYVLLAGGDVTNMGNVFGSQVAVAAGMRASPGTDIVNGVAKTTVNRLWSTEFYYVSLAPTGSAGGWQSRHDGAAHRSGGGRQEFRQHRLGQRRLPRSWPLCLSPTYIGVAASGNISSGTAADTSQLVGLFTDGTVVLDTFGATSKTELYNGVAGWTSPSSLFGVNINQQTKATGDVTINTITVGSNPSALTTTGPVNISGSNVVISSTINHKLDSAGGKQGNWDLNIYGSKSVTITADIGAGQDVYVGASGPITISGNVTSDTDELGAGGIYIYNAGLQSGNTTTISGNLFTAKTSSGDIQIYNYGLANSNVNISGTLTTHNGADVWVYSRGNLKFSGTINSDHDALISALGTQVSLQGPINADAAGATGGFIAFAAPHAATKLYPAAVLTSPAVNLGYDAWNGVWSGTGSIVGVNASGAPYTTAAQKPAAQIITNTLVADLLGNMNAPIAGNTNWLLNSMQVAALDPTLPITASISAVGAGAQFINVGFTGNLIVDSGATATPFSGIGLTTGFFPAGGLIGNGGSQMILNASGSMDIVADSGAQVRHLGGRTWLQRERFLRVPGRDGVQVGRPVDAVRAGVQRVDDRGSGVPGSILRIGFVDLRTELQRDQRQFVGELQQNAGGWYAQHLPDRAGSADRSREPLWLPAGSGVHRTRTPTRWRSPAGRSTPARSWWARAAAVGGRRTGRRYRTKLRGTAGTEQGRLRAPFF